ncbi:hypothetical protein Z969_10165 [Clostridium novyi A str. 4570]|uniref:Uncharacterized protein n=1 Tax=Clostridium novyi A str. 4570 TaxID=1444290 RepID=A0AA88ZIT0_CLONO|nr:hypothetical protein [Clostridium novyi]KGN00092.1 hypothetical protein Z969_10165 [Clostridium novyi A str. 4570]
MFRDVMIDGIKSQYMYTELVENRKIFKRLIDAFFAAAIIGYLKNMYSNKTVKNDKNRRRIPQSVFINNVEEYGIIINTIALLHFNKVDEEDILYKIFDDSDDSWNKKLTIVENYARCGIEILYNELIGKESTNIDDSVEKINKLINDFEDKFQLIEDMKLETFEDAIEKLL